MSSPWRFMTTGDWLLVVALLAIAVAGLARLAGAPSGGRVVVTDGDRTVLTAPLDSHNSFELNGPLGPSRLEIDERGARITVAPCPRRVCMTMGPIRRSGELIACIPNRILVRVEAAGNQESAFDLISR